MNRVRIYLQQELPEYKGLLTLSGGKLVFAVPLGEAFQPFYERVFPAVNRCMARVRNRECDLDFCVRSPAQERDFRISRNQA